MERAAPLRLVHVARRFFSDRDDQYDLMVACREAQEFREPAAVKPFHRAGIQPQRFGCYHQVFASERCVLRGPFEHALSSDGRRAEALPNIPEPANHPFQSSEDANPTLYEKPFAPFRLLLGL